MTYVNKTSSPSRTATAIAVAAIQAGVIYAVATGLAVQFIERPAPAKNPEAYDVFTPTPPEKPKPQPEQKTQRETRTQAPDRVRRVETDLVKPQQEVIVDNNTLTGTVGTGGDGDLVKIPETKPLPPPFVPAVAKPRNAPGSWATAEDYPTSDLRAEHQGVTRFVLSIGTDGRVQGCEVTSSSGFTGLDQTTCDRVTRRARFEAATDSAGNRVIGSYRGSIRWQIPR